MEICSNMFIFNRSILNLTAPLWFLCPRSEFDQLSALLQSRTTDKPLDNEKNRSKVIPSNQLVFHKNKEPVLDTPIKENGIVSQHNLTPVVSSSVGNLFLCLHSVLRYILRTAIWWFWWYFSHVYESMCMELCILLWQHSHLVAKMFVGHWWGCCFSCRACKSLHGK